MTEIVKPSEPPKPRGCLARLYRLGCYASLAGLLLAILACIGLGFGYQKYVVQEPGHHISTEFIQSVIAQDSPVYYRDRETRVGVFFGDEHRHSVEYVEIPQSFQVAIVAAEDGAYWTHPGVNLWGIARAMVSNIQAGRLVAGGSTITQQTAKNLYYRPDRSLKSKWTELINALRLEHHHSKEDILTFYANQFHVHGNGRGIGIAARYFFDRDLTAEHVTWGLLESAYVAGLVKGPSLYDPFLGTQERQERARARAVTRTKYVLRRIVDEPTEHLIGPRWDGSKADKLAQVAALKREAQQLLDEGFELPFKKGRFRYESSAVLDEVKRRLAEPPFDEVLAKAGIEDPRRAGLVVVTTLDPNIQRDSTYAMWHHLTDVGAVMDGATEEDFVLSNHRGPRFEPNRIIVPHEFKVARVTEVRADAKQASLTLDLGGRRCLVDSVALRRVATILKKSRKKLRSASVTTKEIAAFAKRLKVEQIVWVSIRDISEEGALSCDLEFRPELQGAALVLENGEIRAMVGGNDNRNFNRATALRQMGSTWKPLIYHAAMELGWAPEESLDNSRNVFPFSTTFYYPRPDHTPDPTVSMSWAGVNSENLASIWLLYHLMDRLDGEKVRVLAQNLGLSRLPDEEIKTYRRRIQKAGILPTRARLKEQNYLKARFDVLSTIEDSAHPEDALALSSMVYGWGYAGERERVSLAGGKDMGWKLQALDNAWVNVEPWMDTCRGQYRVLVASIATRTVPSFSTVKDLGVWQDGQKFHVSCGVLPVGYVPVTDESIAPLIESVLDTPSEGTGALDSEKKKGPLGNLKSFLGIEPRPEVDVAKVDGPKLVEEGAIIVQDRLHFETLTSLRNAVQRIQLVQQSQGGRIELYDSEYLYWHQDFRVLLAMRYVRELAKQYGVRSPVPPVMSMPLGAAEITLEEATSVYGGLVSGQSWSFPGLIPNPMGWSDYDVPAPPAPTLLISELQDVDGNIIYSVQPKASEVVDMETAEMTSDILRNVVLHGTGRRAKRSVLAHGKTIPVGGKTGTTNEYRNAVFLGFVPKVDGDKYRATSGYIVGSYVGYDNNRPMTRGYVRIDGSRGALPIWIGIANGLEEHGYLGTLPSQEGLDEGTVWPSHVPDSLQYLSVDDDFGLPIELDEESEADTQVLSKRRDLRAELVFQMLFEQSEHPIRLSPSTQDIPASMEEEPDEPSSIWTQ